MSARTPQSIVDQMLEGDAFSRWLGVEVLDLEAGSCRLRMTIRDEMLNGFGTAHGGIAHAFADSALAFASNGRGRRAVAAETQMSYFRPLASGDVIEAIASEEHRSRRLGRYRIEIQRLGERVALFHGTVYVLDLDW